MMPSAKVNQVRESMQQLRQLRDKLRAVEAENKRLREAEGDARELAAFLNADKAPGEQTWQSPWISTGSRIDQLIRKYDPDVTPSPESSQ